jgi:hypothetical protein
MSKNCFRPTVLFAAPGEAITFANRDVEAHTVTGAGDWGTAHGEILTGDAVRIRLEEPGLYLYTCLLHPGMTGAIYVGDGKAIAVAGGTPTDVTSFTEDLGAEPGSGEPQEVQTEQAAATEEVRATQAGTIAGLGLAALGAGFVLGRVLRRPARSRSG